MSGGTSAIMGWVLPAKCTQIPRRTAYCTQIQRKTTCSSLALRSQSCRLASSIQKRSRSFGIAISRKDFNVGCQCSITSSGFGNETAEISQSQEKGSKSIWQKWKENSAEMSAKLAKLGLAAVLAYGLFDAVTYTTFFVLAFLGYEKSTGNNPAANIKALIGIVILMWTGNNVTRPFRVAGAAALAPVIDEGLKRMKRSLNLPSTGYAFALVVGTVMSSCFTIMGLLILSRWGR